MSIAPRLQNRCKYYDQLDEQLGRGIRKQISALRACNDIDDLQVPLDLVKCVPYLIHFFVGLDRRLCQMEINTMQR